MKARYTFRPLESWNRPRTPDSTRRRNPFSASWNDTLALLGSEITKLGGRDAIIELDMDASQIRLDGLPRSSARTNGFPGVMISFESRHGPLRYGSDSCTTWQQNVRAIALGLQSLRAVDRYGITVAGEQYRGFTAIEAKPADAPADAPRDVVERFAGPQGETSLKAWVRKAMFAAHPDHGGSAADWAALRAAAADLGVVF